MRFTRIYSLDIWLNVSFIWLVVGGPWKMFFFLTFIIKIINKILKSKRFSVDYKNSIYGETFSVKY